MALKYEVEKLDDIDESLRPLYTEANGKYVLAVDGVVPKQKLDEFRNNNIALAKERDELLQKYGDVDPELYRKLAEEHNKLKEKKLIDAGKVDELIEERIKAMRASLEQERDTYKEQLSIARQRLEKMMIDNEAARLAVEMGCVDTALDDIVLRARTQFKLDGNDRAIAVDGDKTIYGADGVTPLTIKEWMSSLTKSAPHLFKQSTGGGAAGSNRGAGMTGIRSKADFKSVADKVKYIEEHGQEAYLSLPAK